MIPQLLLDYATVHVARDIEELLDDPSGLTGPELLDYVKTLDCIATMCGADFNGLLVKGTDFEFTRLMNKLFDARAAGAAPR